MHKLCFALTPGHAHGFHDLLHSPAAETTFMLSTRRKVSLQITETASTPRWQPVSVACMQNGMCIAKKRKSTRCSLFACFRPTCSNNYMSSSTSKQFGSMKANSAVASRDDCHFSTLVRHLISAHDAQDLSNVYEVSSCAFSVQMLRDNVDVVMCGGLFSCL